jgi:arabinogalactan endo-1,4-beta-galactosidase
MLRQMHTLRRLMVFVTALVVTSAWAVAVPATAQAAVTQPPSPFDPSPINGQTYYLINQASGLQVDLNGNSTANGDNIVQNTRSFTNLSQRWAMTKAPSGNWLISNMGNGLCLDSLSAGGVAWTVQDRCSVGIATQEWSFTYTTSGYNTITNASTHLALDVLNSSSTAGAKLIQSPVVGAPSQTQLWLPRPTYFLGNDSSLQEKAEADRAFANNANAPWWHDAYLPGQDLVQIFKNNGLNMLRVRPASINTTVVHDGVTFPITTAPYNNYTLAAPPASQVIPASANSLSPGGTSSGDHAQTDWAAVDLAKRAKQLGMSVNVTLFYSGDSTAETPGNWAGMTVDQIAGTPGNPGLIYDYVKQEMELFRANGAWPDLVSIGNEVNTGMFNTTGANGLLPSGTNCTPTSTGGGTGTANCFPRIQIAAMQAIADAATDTSDPGLLGPPLPRPLTCIHTDGSPDLQTFFGGAVNTNGIPLDIACESYYPGWHGPLTQAQQDWHPCTSASCGSTVQHVMEASFAAEANGLGLPIFTMEDGVSYTTAGSPQDPWYGVNPPGPSRNLSRQGMIDLVKAEQNIPHNLSLGMEWWAGEATPIPGGGTDFGQLRGIWTTPGVGVFDASNTAGSALDNATLPVMAAMGGKLDPTLAYKFVNAANARVLQTDEASTVPGAALGTGVDTGITGLQQEWQVLAQGADPHQNAAVYPTPMDHRGDGYFQIANMNQTNGLKVLDSGGSIVSGSPVVQNPQTADVFAITGTNANQEWDILPVGNCGDIPANCSAPPLVSNGDGNFYVIVNKATGKVLATSGTGADAQIQQQDPAAPSNGDWVVPANSGQLWRIVAARITQATNVTTTSVVSSENPSLIDDSVTFTATIAGGSPLAGSDVTFKDGSTVLGSVVLAAGQTTASISTSTLSAGWHSITAEFSGDAINVGSSGLLMQQVLWPFTGFFAPIANLPTLNPVKAGSAIPVEFSLGGDRGLAILAAGSPVSVAIDCTTGAPLGAPQQTVTAGQSPLTFYNGVYTYLWKTTKAWAGTCRELRVDLVDGSTHAADFKFK